MIRIRDLARHLDISIGTVSRALNDKADVNPATRAKVQAAAAKLGYSPNQSGRSLRRGQTDLVGMIIPTGVDDRLISGVFLSVLDGLRRRLRQDGFDLAIFLHGDDEDVFGSLRRIAERGLVDALVISNTLRRDPRIEYLIEKRRPFAAFGRSLSGGGHAWVDPDFGAAVAAAVGRLAALGHRRIGLLSPGGPVNYLHVIREAYLDAMARAGLPADPAWELRQPADERGGAQALAATLETPSGPTALLISDWRQAVGVYGALAEARLKPGEDLSLVGILPEAGTEFLTPVLTTYQTEWTDIGGRLGGALLASIADAGRLSGGARQEIMPVRYVAGQSIGPPRG